MKKNDLRENVIHRDGNLDLKLYPISRALCHWHEELEFILPLQGVCVVTVNGEEITVSDGQALLISSGELHGIESNEVTPGNAIVMHTHICGPECAHLFSGYHIKQLFDDKNKMDAVIIRHLKEICKAVEMHYFGYEFSVKARTADIFSIIFEEKMFREMPYIPSNTSEIFQKLVSYIHENYSKRITLEEMSGYCNYSKNYIVRLFHKYANTTPIEYVTHYRIIRAQTLLRSDNRSVLEIALECGFENVSYFIRTFQRYTKQTPGKWRR